MNVHNILLVVMFPLGGIRTFLRYVYRHFSPKKYRFTLVAPRMEETDVLLQDLTELNLIYIPMDKYVRKPEFFRIVSKTIFQGKFDLVHSHGFTCGVLSTPAAILSRTPHIVTLHETLRDEQFMGITGSMKRLMLGSTLAIADTIHCVSYDARENLLSYLKLLTHAADKLVVIRHGVEVERFLNEDKRDLRRELGLAQNTFLVGFLGRYMPEKGFEFLIDALALLDRNASLPRRPVVLSFNINDGFIREQKANVRRKGLSDSVFFLPFVENVAPTFKGLDVVVMPSLWEACGLLAMEAMVAGVPLIGTDCLGLREVLNNTPATVIPTRDSVALAEALIKEINSPTTAKAREFSREASVRFDVQQCARKIEQLMLKHIKK